MLVFVVAQLLRDALCEGIFDEWIFGWNGEDVAVGRCHLAFELDHCEVVLSIRAEDGARLEGVLARRHGMILHDTHFVVVDQSETLEIDIDESSHILL